MLPIRRKGFTLIELLVVIAIIAILAAILFPVFVSAKGRANTTQCASNLHQLGMAIFVYCDDNNGRFPYQMINPPNFGAPDQTQAGYVDYWHSTKIPCWANSVAVFLKNRGAFRCPSATYGSPGPDQFKQTYCGNGFLFQQSLNQSALKRSSRTVVMYGGIYKWRGSAIAPAMVPAGPRTPAGWSKGYLYDAMYANHSGGYNVLHADGHVKSFSHKILSQHPEWWSPDGKIWY